MPSPNRTVRGLKAIRTHSGKRDRIIIPYRDYLVIATLEREKSRRETERAELLTRVKAVNSRLQFIESKKAEILSVSLRVVGLSSVKSCSPCG